MSRSARIFLSSQLSGLELSQTTSMLCFDWCYLVNRKPVNSILGESGAMEKQKKSSIVRFPAILWAVMAILLCAAPASVAEQIDFPQDYLFVNTVNTPVDLNAEIYYGVYVYSGATLNLLADAIVHYMDAYDGSFVNIYGGIADQSGIGVFDGSTVTVYGTGFIVNNGTIDPSGNFFTVNGIGTLEVTYADGTIISLLVFSSSVPIYLVDTSGGGPIEVQIDIKPGSDQNSINLKSKGVVPVAILTTDNFEAATVDPASALFAGAEPVRWKLEDVDDDGDDDLMLHFKTQELVDLDQDNTEATLTAKLTGQMTAQSTEQVSGGTKVSGTDEVRIVSSKKSKKK